MKSGIKKYVVGLVITASGVATYWYQNSSFESVNLFSAQNSSSELPVHSPKIFPTTAEGESQKTPRQIASRSDSDLRSFPSRPFESPKRSLFLVEGVVGGPADVLGGFKLITKISGISYFEDPMRSSRGLPVVYNKTSKEFGILTGEVSITSGYTKALEIVKRSKFEIVLNDKKAKVLILRASEPEEIEIMLQELSAAGAVPDLDVVYHLAVPK